MVAPWTPFACRGLLWYQGESDVGEFPRYAEKMHTLYEGWSAAFENPSLRLYFAQIAPYGYAEDALFGIQMAQAKFLSEQPNAKMALTCDVGNVSDVHPAQKEVVGKRLALYALKYDYGFSDVSADWPHLSDVKVRDGAFVLSFGEDRAFTVWNEWLTNVKTGFEVAGPDGVWKPAELRNKVDASRGHVSGRVEGATLVVASAEVAQPVRLRYLHRKPFFASIVNHLGQPIPAFELTLQSDGRTARANGTGQSEYSVVESKDR